jgi:hypothetical protein
VTLGLGFRILSFTASGFVLLSCSLALSRDDEQCSDSLDCQRFGPDYVCSTDHVCVTYTKSERGVVGDRSDECRTHADCTAKLGPSLCREGACLKLTDRDIGCLSLDWGTTAPADGTDVVPIGMLVPATELGATSRRKFSGAVGTAINELNRARAELGETSLPAFVGVACDESSDEAISYLTETLGVRAVIGPVSAARAEQVIDQSAGNAVFFLPSADGPNLVPEPSDPKSLVVGCKPNRDGTQTLFLNAIREVTARVEAETGAPPEAVLAVSEDAPTASFAASLNDKDLAAAGVRRLEYIAGGRDLVSALRSLSPPPSLVVAASGEDDWVGNISAVDAASFVANDFYPYYFVGEKRFELLATLTDLTTAEGYPRQYHRMLGLDYHKDERSKLAYEDFRVAFELDPGGGAGAEPDPGLEYAYDCTYVAAYATAAARERRLTENEPSPDAIVLSLDALSGGQAVPVRAQSVAQALELLAEKRGTTASLDLLGSSGDLDFSADTSDASGRLYYRRATPDGELYCIPKTGVKTFCDTGVVFPADGGESSADNGECACMGAP